jgi:hypothetical protein
LLAAPHFAVLSLAGSAAWFTLQKTSRDVGRLAANVIIF